MHTVLLPGGRRQHRQVAPVNGSLRLLVALGLASLALRPQLTAIGPLLPRIEHDLRLSHATAGLLGTIPVLCKGRVRLATPALVVRFGSGAVFAAALEFVGLSSLLRAAVPGAAGVLLLTLVFGIAAGVGGAVLPIVVKERFQARPTFATGVYSVGINGGAAGAAAAAVPLADRSGGWRSALALLAILAIAFSAAWTILARRQLPPREPELRLPRLPWRRGIGWTLALVFGLQATCFHGLSIWLADAYQERGWIPEGAGALVASFQSSTLLVSWGAARLLNRRTYMAISAALLTCSITALETLPEAGWMRAVLAGLACGSLFPLALTLSVDLARDPREAGGVAALMLGGGYTLAAVAPVALRLARGAAGSFTAGLWMLTGVAGLLLVVTLLFSPPRLQRAAAT